MIEGVEVGLDVPHSSADFDDAIPISRIQLSDRKKWTSLGGVVTAARTTAKR